MCGGKIKSIHARQVLDCNGRPVVEAEIVTQGGAAGCAGASTGTSVGSGEAFVLRDGDPGFYSGLSVCKAVRNVNEIIAPALIGMDVEKQEEIDDKLIELDGTKRKTRLGGNAIFAVSAAAAYAAADLKNMQLYESMTKKRPRYLFAPASNVINGGRCGGIKQDFQEFMIVPKGITSVKEAIRMVVEIFMYLPELIAKETGREVDLGSYSGHAAPDEDPFAVMDLLERAVGKLGYKKNICYALDCAATGYYDVQEKAYRYRGKLRGREEMIAVLKKLSMSYPFAFMEDVLEENDFEGFAAARKQLNTVVVGDDLLCTDKERIQKAVKIGAADGVIFKPNQAGTVTEALEAARYAKEQGMLVIPSGRAGGVLDDPEKEIGFAYEFHMFKTGAPREGSRTADINFMLRTEEKTGIPMLDIEKLPIMAHLGEAGH